MKFLSIFIWFYFIVGLYLLIPFANSISNDKSDSKDYSHNFSHSGFDENSQTNIEKSVDKSANIYNHVTWNFEPLLKSFQELHINNKALDQPSDIETEANKLATNYFSFTQETLIQNYVQTKPVQTEPDFWTTLYSVESKQGRLLYRPSNKNRNCNTTSSPCGHHQLSLQALKDISCVSSKCKSDRENFTKSLAMSKQLQAINDKRLKKAGYVNLPEYQKYLIHQQGATGLKIILGASEGKKLLSRNMKRKMAGNSPYSYKKLRRFGSKLAAKKFLKHWEEKWQDEKKLVIAANTPNKSVETAIKQKPDSDQDLFNDYELQIALNLKI